MGCGADAASAVKQPQLLDVDDACPVDEQFVVLRRLVAAGFRRGDDREPLLHVGELDLQRLARERHVLLRRRDVAREPEQEIRARDISERIAEAHVAPVDHAPVALRRDDHVRRIEVAVAERLPAREALELHVQVVARLARQRRGGNLLVELVREVTHALGRLGEDLALDRDELLQVLHEVFLVLRHHVGKRLALDPLAADAPVVAEFHHLDHLGDGKARLGGARLVHRLVQDCAHLVARPEHLEHRVLVLRHDLVGTFEEDPVLFARTAALRWNLLRRHRLRSGLLR